VNKFRNLRKLNFALNKLEILVDLELANLEELNLSRNKLKKFPNLAKCPRLQILNLSYNKISTIKYELRNLRILEQIDISYNNIGFM